MKNPTLHIGSMPVYVARDTRTDTGSIDSVYLYYPAPLDAVGVPSGTLIGRAWPVADHWSASPRLTETEMRTALENIGIRETAALLTRVNEIALSGNGFKSRREAIVWLIGVYAARRCAS